ncbi:methyl-accepting chemotaxis protein [Eubacteriales bacterium OttesenSCG-928-A19]|nr:methyl-accepting chemotaxis protein [Eubacteriales bacterium OttesenSCG-928-A19]
MNTSQRKNSKPDAASLSVILMTVTLLAAGFIFLLAGQRVVALCCMAASLVLLLLLFFYLRRAVWKPLEKLGETARQMAVGAGGMPERTAASLNAFALISEALHRLAHRNELYDIGTQALLNREPSLPVPGVEDDTFAGELNAILSDNAETLHRISAAAENVAQGARDMLQSGIALSNAMAEQAGAIEQITESITEISLQAGQNARSALEAKEVAENALSMSAEGNERMQELIASIHSIDKAIRDIYTIAKFIDSLAFQTNLLALNAAIEAAKAEGSGKGFAVVAGEVRDLATKSAKAATETKELLETSFAKAASGIQMAESMAATLESIIRAAQSNSPLMEAIAEASQEQSVGIDQINKAVEQLAGNTETTLQFTDKSAIASQELTMQADLLCQMSGSESLRPAPAEASFSSVPSAPYQYARDTVAASDDDALEIDLDNDDYGKYV